MGCETWKFDGGRFEETSRIWSKSFNFLWHGLGMHAWPLIIIHLAYIYPIEWHYYMHQSWTVYVELGGSICRLHSLSLESDQSCLDNHLFRNIIQCSIIAHDHNYMYIVWMLTTPRLSIVIWLMKHVTWHPNYCPILNFSTETAYTDPLLSKVL